MLAAGGGRFQVKAAPESRTSKPHGRVCERIQFSGEAKLPRARKRANSTQGATTSTESFVERLYQPSLRDLSPYDDANPMLKHWAIFIHPFGMCYSRARGKRMIS